MSPQSLLQPLPAYDAFTLHSAGHCGNEGNGRERREWAAAVGAGGGNNSPFAGLFSSETVHQHNSHSTPSSAFYDPAKPFPFLRVHAGRVQNPYGYAFTQLFGPERVGAIANVKLLLAHGKADDNVHYQNSALFARELQERSIHFTQLVYANEAHGIGGLYRHLYAEFDRFLDEQCFNAPNKG